MAGNVILVLKAVVPESDSGRQLPTLTGSSAFWIEYLSRIIFFGEASLHRVHKVYVAHYHIERNHQDVDNRLPESFATVPPPLPVCLVF
jgi:hypothetical protein